MTAGGRSTDVHCYTFSPPVLIKTFLASSRPSGYMPQLDGLRVLAVGAVMVHHWSSFRSVLVDTGNAGVLLFFVLSGYLITDILARARQRALDTPHATRGGVLKAFYARRFLRIFPLYYGIVGLFILANVGPARDLAPWLLTYTHNVLVAAQGWTGDFSHFWSLAVEEQFYLVWPLVVLALPRQRALAVAIGMAALAPMLIAAGDAVGLGLPGTLLTSNLSSLGLGAALALLGKDTPRGATFVARAGGLGAIGYVAFTLALIGLGVTETSSGGVEGGGVLPTFVFGLRQLAMAGLSVWLIARAAAGFRGPVGAVLESRPMVYLGTISYGLYVFHNFAHTVWDRIAVAAGLPTPFVEDPMYQWPFYLVITIVVSALSWHLFEQPINRLKSRFPYVRPGAPTPPVAPRRAPGREIPVP